MRNVGVLRDGSSTSQHASRRGQHSVALSTMLAWSRGGLSMGMARWPREALFSMLEASMPIVQRDVPGLEPRGRMQNMGG
jgi:hypothetical protein